MYANDVAPCVQNGRPVIFFLIYFLVLFEIDRFINQQHLKMKSVKRSNDCELDDNNPKKIKVGEAEKTGETPFLSPVKAYILQAGIEKMRMNIFQAQLERNGGTLCKDMTADVTHLIVDDKMESDRMCRVLKIDTPPTNICIIKSGWLSACFRQKALLDTSDFLLDCSLFAPIKSNDSQSKDNETHIPSAPCSTSSDKNNTPLVDSKPELPMVGMMFDHKAKAMPSEADDSDYCPSGKESDEDMDQPDPATTPSTSPKKYLPVSMTKYQ